MKLNPRIAYSGSRAFRLILGLLIGLAFASSLHAESLEDEVELSKARKQTESAFEIERDWASPLFVPDPYPESPVSSASEKEEAQLRRAYSFLLGASELAQKMSQELKTDTSRSIRDPLWWKEVDANSAERRRQNAVRQRYGIELAERYNRVFQSLQELDRTAFQSDPRVTWLKRHAYRQYIVIQSAVGNYIPALELLEEYARLPSAEAEWPMHYYFFVCLNHIFTDLRRSTAVREETLIDVRARKNSHWLRAVELKFGKQSAQFEEVARATAPFKNGGEDSPRSPVRPYGVRSPTHPSYKASSKESRPTQFPVREAP